MPYKKKIIICIKKNIEKIIDNSSVPEDPFHSKNTLQWLLKLNPKADEALQIAALGHDIDRATNELKVKREHYKDYDEFKQAHALNSANILKKIMSKCKAEKEFIEDVCSLIYHHEIGGNTRSDLLKNADSISFFDVNLPFYFARNSIEETKKRWLWGYKKLSYKAEKIVGELKYKNKELTFLVKILKKK